MASQWGQRQRARHFSSHYLTTHRHSRRILASPVKLHQPTASLRLFKVCTLPRPTIDDCVPSSAVHLSASCSRTVLPTHPTSLLSAVLEALVLAPLYNAVVCVEVCGCVAARSESWMSQRLTRIRPGLTPLSALARLRFIRLGLATTHHTACGRRSARSVYLADASVRPRSTAKSP